MYTTNQCIACGSKQEEQNVILFRFPRNAVRCRKWIEISGLTQLLDVPATAIYEKYRLCSLHFDSTQFRTPRSVNNQQRKLIRNALPTLFNGAKNGRKRSAHTEWPGSTEELQILASHLCRLCANVSDDLVEVFGEEGQRLDLCNKIHTHLPIMVTEDDVLPTSCCCTCISKLELCHNFAMSSLDANSKLYTVLRLPKPVDNQINTVPDGEDSPFLKITRTQSLAYDIAKNVNRRKWNNHRGLSKISSTRCNICKLQFINERRLHLHEAVVHKNLHFKCRHCGKLFMQQNNLRRHIAVHRKSYTCKICFESLPTYQLMLSHQRSHIRDDESSRTESENEDLISVPTVTENKNIDSFCNLQSTDDTVKVKTEPPFSVNTPIGSQIEENLVDPLSLDRPIDDAADSILPNCELTVTNEPDIRLADSSNMPSIQEPEVERPLINIVASLSHSNIVFRTQIIQEPEIVEAVNSIKEDSLPYEHQICQVEYDQSYVNATAAHEIVTFIDSEASNNSNELYHCSSCNKIFTTELAYRSHASKHTVEKKFICATCNRPFAHQWALDSHLRIHSDEKPFACSICGEKFLFKRSLVVHERNHTENKSFKCNVCEKYFNSVTRLRQHIITHSDDWPFKCTFCSREFRRREALKTHILKHTDECKLCNHKSDLKENKSNDTHRISHMKTEDKVSSENCVIFGEFGSSDVVIESHTDAAPLLNDANVACEYVI